MCSILLVGYDLWLLQTRALILRETEAAVYTCRPDQLEEATGDRQIDLVILCHSLSDAARRSVSAEAHRRWPQVRVLQVVKNIYSSEKPDLYADDVVASCDPGILIHHARKLLKPMPCEPGRPHPRQAFV